MKKSFLIFAVMLLFVSNIMAQIASGTCGGNLTWRLSAEGELTIEGTGEMTSTSWNSYSEQISTVTIGEGVTNIGDWYFASYPNLTSVTIPASVTIIRSCAFMNCSSLASVAIAENSQMATIGGNAFKNCSNLTLFTLPASVTTIGNDAFWGTGLISFTIPENSQLTTINDWAFNGCAGLTTISFPASLTSIGHYAFNTCKFTSITCNALTPPSAGAAFPSTEASTLVYVPTESIDAYKAADGWSRFTNWIIASGTCGDNLTWRLSAEGELTIEGTGAMTDYSYGNWAPWYDYKESIVSINIGEGVSTIANQTFRDCTNLIAVTVPASVATIGELAFYNCPSLATANMAEDSQLESIGYNAFRGCKNLTDFAIPATVTNIGEHAFHGCEELASITIPVGMTTIETRAFQDCRKFNTITIPAGVTTIKDCAFSGCENLETINFPENSQLIAIGTEAFYNCQKLGSVIIPASVTTMGEGVFKSCIGLISATIPAGVTTIEYETFESCSSLTNVVFPENSQLTTIGTEAFWSSGLTSIAIPANVTTIGRHAFRYCDNLTSFIIPDNSQLTTIGFASFLGCSALTSITLPAGLTSLDMAAFKGCTGLTTMTCNATTPPAANSSETFYDINRSIPVYVPVSAIDAYKEADYWKEFTNFLPMGTCGDNLTWKLTEEGELIIEGTGDMYNYHEEASGINHPWLKCRSQIKTITIGEGVTSIGNTAFRDCTELTSISLNNDLKHIGVEAFRYCGKLTAIDFPESLTSIANSSFFECRGLLSVTIPEGVTSIDFSTFSGCSSLKSLILPSGITSIGGNAFKACHNLTEIVCRATTPPSISSNTFNSVSREAFVYVPHASIGAYESAEHWSEFTNIQPMIIASGFCGDDLIWRLNDAYELTIEGTGAMYDYSNSTAAPWQSYAGSIKSVVIKTGVTGIGSWAFSQCSALTDVSIAESVIRIGGDAFRECSTLEEITLPKGLTELGTGVFLYCYALKSIIVPEGVTKIGSDTFEFCPQLSSITFPSGLTEIGAWALKGAYNLTSITCKAATPPSLEREVFSGVNTETPIYVPASSVEAYKTAYGWNQFANIQPIILASGTCGDDLAWKLTDEGELTIEGTGAMTDYEPHSAPWFAYKDEIKTVTIKPGVTTIGKYAIGDCSNLTTVTIPEGVTSIGLQAFQYCYKLTSVTLSDGLKTIDWGAFAECHELPSIDIPEGVTTIGNYAFTHCFKLSTVTIPESVTSIGIYAFRNTAITSVMIPANISSLSQGTFENCPNLSSITCKAETPPSVGHFETFYNVNRSIPVYVPVSAIDAYKEADYWKEFTNFLPMGTCGDNLTWVLTDEGELIVEGTGDMYDYEPQTAPAPWNAYRELIMTVTLSEVVASIGDYAFRGCCLTDITIPKNSKLTSIGNGAFESCTSLITITIPEGVTSIGKSAFDGCSSLTSSTIPEGVTSIGYGTFRYCSLTDITIPEGVTSIEKYAFYGCSSLTAITCHAVIPPTIENSNTFNKVPKSIPVYVPVSAVDDYKEADYWKEFTNIQAIPEIITINQYGSSTYCSEYALDFSEVAGLKAYAATGYDTETGVVTLTRVMTAKAGVGLFIKGEPGEYTVTTLENTSFNTLNMLVGTLEKTELNGTSGDGLYANYKYTIKEGDAEPMFYQFADGSTLSAERAYLQIPTKWLPKAESKAIRLRFVNGETTDIEEIESTDNYGQTTIIYDLMGRRVENPSKGCVYIVNGRKVVY